MATTISPNMNLILPIVGVEPGPTWATDLNSSLTIIDQHNHTSGSGNLITPAAMQINADLSYQSNNAIALRSARLTSQVSPLALSTDLLAIYAVGNDLYYNDGLGNQIRITQSGAVAGTPGSISSLVAPASASYSAFSQTFTWQSGSNLAANMDFGSAVLRNLTVSSFGLTLSPPTLAADYTITLPQLPVLQSFLTINNSGGIAAPVVYPLATAGIAANAVTNAKRALVGQVVSATIASFALTQNVDVPNSTTAGLIILGTRPVDIRLVPIANSTSELYVSSGTANSPPSASVRIIANDGLTDFHLGQFIISMSAYNQITNQGAGSISAQGINTGNATANSGIAAGPNNSILTSFTSGSLEVPCTVINTLAIGLAAGTYTFRLYPTSYSSGTSLAMVNCRLVAYEL